MKSNPLATLALVTCMTATATWAQTPPPPATTDATAIKQSPPPAGALPRGLTEVTTVEGITEYRLGNGLQLLLVPDDSKPTTTVNLTFRVGSRHENYGETGMAHLLEHLIFKDTPTHKAVDAEFSRRGFRYNGTTSFDRTNYFASFATNDDNLRWYLGWLADVMVNSPVAKADLDTEMTVVRNEMEMGENNPGQILYQRLLGSMFDWHNYANMPIGARTDVENVDISRLQAFYKQYYQPDNATLIVAGRFDAAKVRVWATETFGTIAKPTRALPPTYTLDPAQDGERSVTVRRVGGTPMIYVGHHMPAGASLDATAADLLVTALADAPSGRLHKRLVESKLAAGVFGDVLQLAEPGVLLAGAQLGAQQSVDKARAAIVDVLDGLARQPLTAAELERARTKALNAWRRAFTNPEAIGVQLSEAIALGDWRMYFLRRDQLRQVTLADVNRVAQQYLKPDNRTIATYVPTAQPQRAPAPAKVDTAALVKDYKGDTAAASVAAFEATPANLQQRSVVSRLPSGMRVSLLPKPTRGQAVQARLALHFGDEKSLFGRGTAVEMLGSMMRMGGAGMTRQQVADAFDQLQAQVAFAADGQTLSVSIVTVREHLPGVIELVGKLLRNPALPPAALDELKREALAAIDEKRHEPDALVENALARHGNPYPPGDLRYVETLDEMAKNVKAVTVTPLREVHERHLSAAASEFSAAGDLDPAAVQRSLAAAFGTWAKPARGTQAYLRAPDPWVDIAAKTVTIATPDKQNATMVVQLSLPLNDTHADFIPMLVANHLFGGDSNARSWVRIREKEGLSYGVWSSVDWSQHEPHSTWRAQAIFAPANRAKIEAAWREELDRSLADGFTAAEVEAAKASLLNTRKLSRAQDAVVASQALNLLHLGRDWTRAQKIDDAIAAVTPGQVNAAWRKHLQRDKLVFGWGGDFKAVP